MFREYVNHMRTHNKLLGTMSDLEREIEVEERVIEVSHAHTQQGQLDPPDVEAGRI